MNKEAHICFLYPFMTLNILCVVLKNTKVQIPKTKIGKEDAYLVDLFYYICTLDGNLP